MTDHPPASKSISPEAAEPEVILPNEQSHEKQLSKKALKRLEKRAQWEVKKKLKRQLEKEKRKELGLPNRSKGGGKRRRRFKKMKESSCKLHIVVDLSFDELMMEKDLYRCSNQVNRCYSVNRALPNPVQFHVTSFTGASTVAMAKQVGFVNWDVVFHEKPYDEVFEKDRLVYLTSDSKNVLTELDENKVYVIGGLVDHNAKKVAEFQLPLELVEGLCHHLAAEKGITHARLPIKEWIDMKTRCVLSINQVFSIVANVAQGTSWQTAILNAIPQRKNAQPKTGPTDDSDSGANDDEDEEVGSAGESKDDIDSQEARV